MARFCPGCGNPVQEASRFCPSCGTKLEGAGVSGQMLPRGREEKSPYVALLCSFFIPGLGQVYDGNTARGIGVFIGTIGGFFLFIVPGLIFWIYGMHDAYSTAKRMNRGEIPFRATRTAHLIIFFIIAVLIIALIVFMILMALLAEFNSVFSSMPAFSPP